MQTAVTAALAEIDAALTRIPPQHEGLKDFARLNLQRDTQQEILVSLEQYDRRVRKLLAAQAALEQLIVDGHPDLLAREISPAAFEDLQQNARTIDAALRQFTTPTTASTLGLAAGAAEAK